MEKTKILLEEGIPAPMRKKPKKLSGLSIKAAIKSLKKGQCILVTGAKVQTVRVAASQMRSEIAFRTTTREIKNENGVIGTRVWRVG